VCHAQTRREAFKALYTSTEKKGSGNAQVQTSSREDVQHTHITTNIGWPDLYRPLDFDIFNPPPSLQLHTKKKKKVADAADIYHKEMKPSHLHRRMEKQKKNQRTIDNVLSKT